MATSTSGIELRSFEFDTASGTYRAGYEPAVTPPSMAVIGFVARILECCPTEMDPLQATVDTDALNGMLSAADEVAAAVEVSFRYEDYEITARSDEIVAEDGFDSDEIGVADGFGSDEIGVGDGFGSDEGIGHDDEAGVASR